jgi:hypothetical protein
MLVPVFIDAPAAGEHLRGIMAHAWWAMTQHSNKSSADGTCAKFFRLYYDDDADWSGSHSAFPFFVYGSRYIDQLFSEAILKSTRKWRPPLDLRKQCRQ